MNTPQRIVNQLLKTCVCALLLATATTVAAAEAWQAGVAKVDITPAESMWMAGYASRKKPSEGVALPLYAKALAIEDARGARLVIVTTDLIGIPRPLRDYLAAEAEKQFKLPPQGLLLNASHTHCGPELRGQKYILLDLADERQQQGIAYFKSLQQKLLAIIGQSLENLAPAELSYQHARAGFAMNRRTPVAGGYQNHPYSDGPVDHDVPVLKVQKAGEKGELLALLFGYSCHNTTLSFFQFCGDYAGYAQDYLEEAHPGATALFLNGASGDQNPYPRGTLDLAKQHGRALANGVEAALQTNATPLTGPLATALEEATLQFAPPPPREQLQRDVNSPNAYEASHAKALLKELDENRSIRDTYDYPVQVVQFGDKLTLVALAGELVVDYSLRLKRELAGPAVWIAGYSNDVFGYVPSKRVLEEGGYEGGGAMLYTTLPGPFAPSVEERIIGKVQELVKQVQSR